MTVLASYGVWPFRHLHRESPGSVRCGATDPPGGRLAARAAGEHVRQVVGIAGDEVVERGAIPSYVHLSNVRAGTAWVNTPPTRALTGRGSRLRSVVC